MFEMISPRVQFLSLLFQCCDVSMCADCDWLSGLPAAKEKLPKEPILRGSCIQPVH